MTLEKLCSSETTDLELKVICNFIRKDLEVYRWINQASKQFGDFTIFEDYKLELNCFDQGLSLLINREIRYGEDCLESYATSKCIEYLMSHDSDEQTNAGFLAASFTIYLSDVSRYFLQAETVKNKRHLDAIFKKHFPVTSPEVLAYLNFKYSSNIA
jgi:hypothetical protein